MKYFFIITCILMQVILSKTNAQNNLLIPQRIDSLRSYSTSFGETSNNYFFSANYFSNNNSDFFHSARIISINKITNQENYIEFEKVADTSFYIARMVVINDTIHSVVIQFWNDSLLNINHFRYYSKKYNNQLQLISSKLIFTMDDTDHIFSPVLAVEINNNVYFIVNYYAQPQMGPNGSIVKYSIYNSQNDSVIVNEHKLNPNYASSSYWSEFVQYVSTNDSGNLIVSCRMAGNVSNGPLTDNFLVRLNKNDNYSNPEKIQYFFWDSTFNYEMSMVGNTPYVESHKASYFFISKSQADYFNNTTLSNTKIGVYKGRYRDSFIKMDTSYNTSKNNSYGVEFGAAHFNGFKEFVLKNDTLLFIYAGNNEAGSYYPYPCQDSLSALEIVVLDTNMNEKKKHTILNYQRNSAPSGFEFTQSGDIMVWGYQCPRGGSEDSTSLFAFLLDYNTGFPVNVMNAGSFINTNQYKVYPNPFRDEITIEGMQSEHLCFELYDAQGRRVLKQFPKGYKSKINTSDLPSGFYFYKIKDEVKNIINTGKLIKPE